jgi:glycosyltransferase involved in cell wall biosynthesis
MIASFSAIGSRPADTRLHPTVSTSRVVGVSVVICSHNGDTRLRPTLEHLAAQKEARVPWEVIVVDNASTDSTSQLAVECWPEAAPVSLRVVREPRLGLSHARERGFAESQYEVVSFIDDDNWVCDSWITVVAEIFTMYPDVGACGGLSEAVPECDPPEWFDRYCAVLAVGSPVKSPGFMAAGTLWGAGLCIRKSAWSEIVRAGFRSRLTDRKGALTTSCGDTEICFALRLAGWQLWYEPSLQFKHYIPAQRLSWAYFRRLHRGIGKSIAVHGYEFMLHPPLGLRGRVRKTRIWILQTALRNLFRQRTKILASLKSPLEGDPQVFQMEFHLGRAIGALTQPTTGAVKWLSKLNTQRLQRSRLANATVAVGRRSEDA